MIHSVTSRLRLLAVATIFTLVSCVAPAFNQSQYQSKVASTASDSVSVLETIRLAVQESDRHGIPTNPMDVLISGQEDVLGSIAGTFSSVQPPDVQMQQLRNNVLDLLDRAQTKVEQARIAFRNNDVDAALSIIESVEPISKQLDDIANRY